MSNSREQVLTSGVLAKFVIGNEGHRFRVLTLLKEKQLDPIYFSVGLPNLNSLAGQLQMRSNQVGFAGRVQGFIGNDAVLTNGGESLGRGYERSPEEQRAAFDLISAMLAQIGGTLSWR